MAGLDLYEIPEFMALRKQVGVLALLGDMAGAVGVKEFFTDHEMAAVGLSCVAGGVVQAFGELEDVLKAYQPIT